MLDASVTHPAASHQFAVEHGLVFHGAFVPAIPAPMSLHRFDERTNPQPPDPTRLNEYARELYRQEVQGLVDRLNTHVPEDQPGALDRVDNNIAQLEARVTTDVQNASTLLGAYDAALQALHTEQVWLGQAAFSDEAARKGGIAGLMDTAVQYGTLKAALGVARRRDR